MLCTGWLGEAKDVLWSLDPIIPYNPRNITLFWVIAIDFLLIFIIIL